MARFRVIGVGNPLMGDDGVGPALVRRLAEVQLPSDVDVFDGGTAGLTLLDLMKGVGGVVLVDAAELGRPPGTIVRLSGPQLDIQEPDRALSAHHPGLAAALALGRALDVLPELVLFLVQVARVEPGADLSLPVRRALESLLVRVSGELARMASGPESFRQA